MTATVIPCMAAPALAVAPITSGESSEDETHPPRALLTGDLLSANTGSLRAPVSRDRVHLPKPLSSHYREDSYGSSSNSSATSWEDYDALKAEPGTTVVGAPKDSGVVGKPTVIASEMHISSLGQGGNGETRHGLESPAQGPDSLPAQHSKRLSITVEKVDEAGRCCLTADDPELREILRRGLERQSQGPNAKKRSRFSDLVFTRQLTAFDRQNPSSASSTFHGFFTLFWLGTALLLLRVGANNWRTYGSVFGRNEIMTMMFHRDVAVLGLTDGVMCASTVFCLVLQKAITGGYLSCNKQGWIIQNVSITLQLSQERYRPWMLSSPLHSAGNVHVLIYIRVRSFGKPRILARSLPGQSTDHGLGRIPSS